MMKTTVGRAPSRGKQLLKGLAWATGWTAAASLAAAWMLEREFLKMEQVGYGSMGILLVCGWILGRNGAMGEGARRLISAGIGTAVFFACLLGVNWMFFGGKTDGFGVTLAVLLVGTALGCTRPRKGRGGVPRRRYKIPKT